MTSIADTIFMMKFNFYQKNIKQYSKVKIITIINNSCLVEDINTLNRCWVMKYDIYPLNNILYEYWEYSQHYEEIAINNNLK